MNAEQLPREWPCPVCGTLVTRGETLFRCLYCGHGYRAYAGDTIEYHDQEFRQHHSRAEGEFDAEGHVAKAFHESRRELVDKRVRRIGKLLKQTDSVLDVGGGAGTFAKAISDRVASVEMLEVNSEFVRHARDELGIVAHETSLEDCSLPAFDVVFAWHVVEHLRDLEPAITRLKRLFLNYLVVEVPMQRGVPARFDGHHHYFTDESLQLVFSDLVVRMYGDGVQAPSRLAVFTKRQQQRRISARVRNT